MAWTVRNIHHDVNMKINEDNSSSNYVCQFVKFRYVVNIGKCKPGIYLGRQRDNLNLHLGLNFVDYFR